MKIALYMNTLDEEYQITVFRCIRRECQKLGINLICVQGEAYTKKRQDNGIPFPSREFLDVDGILLLSSVVFDDTEITDKSLISELFSRVPAISVGSRVRNLPSIEINSRRSVGELMKHLLYDHRYKKLLFLGGPEHHTDTINRQNIFNQCIEEAKTHIDGIESRVVYGGFHEVSGNSEITRYIDEHPHDYLDVIVAANDNMAIGAMRALQNRDDEHWHRCAVTGFDDIPQARHEVPSLTTVHQPLPLMCRIAVQELYDILQGKQISPLTRIDSSVAIRNSCGCTHAISPMDFIDETADSQSLRKEITRIEYQAIRNEQYNRSVSYLGERLIASKNMDEVVYHLQQFVKNIGARRFYYIMYQNPETSVPREGIVRYRKVDESEFHGSSKSTPNNLKNLFSDMMSQRNGASLSLYHLVSGREFLGMVVYEVEDFAQPHMCSSAIFLANTIKRLRMLEEEKERSRHLEDLVAARTRDLVLANKRLQEEARKRIQVEAEVLKISEMERLRFSLDLHDDICQRLAAISMFSRSIQKAPGVKELTDMLDETLQRTRQYAHNSYPMELGNLGLNDALGNLCHTIDKQISGVCTYTWDAPEKSPLSAPQEINVYRIVQEALQNAVKHSQAGMISVMVSSDGNYFKVQVHDNGIGSPGLSDCDEILHNYRKRPRGLGMRSMEYRARQMGAEYHIESSRETGTVVRIMIPLNGVTPAEEQI
ncbi:MAG: substrate-binding domain-containing protein [Spirochaetales bacterium]|nr:substrate-binding domain-containing protein [Spirochaetales bacterium]